MLERCIEMTGTRMFVDAPECAAFEGCKCSCLDWRNEVS